MRSLRRLVRGLSALFWGLPATLVVCFHTARLEGISTLGPVPAMALTGLLVYALWQMGAFQPQERVWRRALDAALLLAFINFGLSPFLFFWNRVPGNSFFFVMAACMIPAWLLFLASVNHVLKRLGAMLPDEALRIETRQFTALNQNMVITTFVLIVVYLVLQQVRELPFWLDAFENAIERGALWFLVLLVLLPLAMTMALLWKTKEVILESIFGTDS